MDELININVIKNNRKRMVIKINKINQNVVVYAPLKQSDKLIKLFIEANTDWIKKTLKEIKANQIVKPNKFLYFGKEFEFEISSQFSASLTLIDKMYIRPEVEDINKEINKFYFKIGSDFVYKKLIELSNELDLPFQKLTFRNVRGRWGSCSMKKNISINIKLLKAPQNIINYVLIHELCHLKEMNHSRAFWALVAKADPNYKEHRKWLKANGGLLLADYIINDK